MIIKYTTGYAGTGKSTELLSLLETLSPETAVVLAPTHKALIRLATAYDGEIELRTIHSILGWIPGINENAEHISHIDTTIKLANTMEMYTDIVVDEAGMMSEDMLMELTGKIEEMCDFKTDKITLHLFLDPYQLLPVKGIQIQTDPTTTTHLTTQHRGESPDVVALFTKFVNYLEGTNTMDLSTPSSQNVINTNSIKGFREGDRLLAYTNATVGKYNNLISTNLGITSYVGQEVQLGSLTDLYMVDKFIKPSYQKLLDAYESNTLMLQNSQINKKFLEQSLKALMKNKHIQFIQAEGMIIPVIPGIGEAYIIRNKAKEAAISDRKKFQDVYALNRAFTMDYSFASTVHKSQGSEFDRVWIDKLDIQKSIFGGSYKNYARLMYVAISRAKQTVFIL